MAKAGAGKSGKLTGFEATQRAYLRRLASLADDIARTWASHAAAAPWDGAGRHRYILLTALAHSITGSAGPFGFASVSKAAAPVERLMRGIADALQPPGSDVIAQAGRYVDHLLRTLRVALERGAALPPARPAPGRTAPRVALLGGGSELTERLDAALGQYGYDTEWLGDPLAARDRLAADPPAALVLDLTAGLGGLDGMALIDQLAPVAPLLVVSDRADFDARLAAARAGVAAYLVRPVDIDEMIVWLDRLTGMDAEDRFGVLLVVGDRLLADTYALTLAVAGIRAEVLTDPRGILDALDQHHPDIIVMDSVFPDCQGLHLARVIRQLRAHVGVPIMFLSRERDPVARAQATGRGGDDLLLQPVDPEHLVIAVASRAERARAVRAAMERDSLTGLLNHGRIKDRLAVELARSQRQEQPVSFALIDLDHFKRVNDSHGHQVGDAVLKGLARLLLRRLRRTDVVGRYGGEEFAIILPGTSGSAALTVLDELRCAFKAVPFTANGTDFTVTFSGGICVGAATDDVDAVIERADAALYRAKHAGRDRICLADGLEDAAAPEPVGGRRVDRRAPAES